MALGSGGAGRSSLNNRGRGAGSGAGRTGRSDRRGGAGQSALSNGSGIRGGVERGAGGQGMHSNQGWGRQLWGEFKNGGGYASDIISVSTLGFGHN